MTDEKLDVRWDAAGTFTIEPAPLGSFTSATLEWDPTTTWTGGVTGGVAVGSGWSPSMWTSTTAASGTFYVYPDAPHPLHGLSDKRKQLAIDVLMDLYAEHLAAR